MFGWIERLLRLDKYTFYVDANGGWAGAEIEDLLNACGIELSGRFPALPWEDELFFDVPLEDAGRARNIMFAAGVPLLRETDLPTRRRLAEQQSAAQPAEQQPKPADGLEALDLEMAELDSEV